MPKKVFISNFDMLSIHETLKSGLEWININKIIFPGAKVFIKPNFTYPFYKPGVTTSPIIIEECIKILSNLTSNITIGETDGGSNAWQAEEAFVSHNFPYLSKRYGVQVVNLSDVKRERAETYIDGRKVCVELPSMLLQDVDVFITLPVPKVHIMTEVSLAFKNQWGCIPDVKRLRYHHNFDHTVLAINKLLRTRIAVYDGTYFLDRTGPMEGDAIRMNLLMVANDPGAGDLVCCHLMGLDPNQISHLNLAKKVKMMPDDFGGITLNVELKQFKKRNFRLEKTLLHRITLFVFKSRWATWLIYESFLAKPIHAILYFVRGYPNDVKPQW